ncbi:PTS fructose transporter subunit IIA [Ruminococcus sp. AF14-10]|nr:PTS fructose transporter subunit IIA [Ruminococcus sp. AF14-10]
MQKRFNSDQIIPGLPGIIILSHGPMAISMIDSASLIAGNIDNLAAFIIEEGDDSYSFGDMFTEAIKSYDAGALVLIDFFGGTPFNQILYHSKKDCLNIEALTGVSMPMLIESIFSRTNDLVSWVQQVKESSELGLNDIHDLIHEENSILTKS